MPRPTRIEYPHAFYHIMNRGRNKDDIFLNDSDFQLFLDIIGESKVKFNAVIHCYCLMNNHYHLLLETPDANLREIMHFIGSEYVRKYNRRKGFDGSLFKGRYKALLVDQDSYLIELNRYIHRNPIFMTKNLKDYKWSSYPAYLNITQTPFWLNKELSLKILGHEKVLTKYADLVESKREKELYDGCKNTPSILGDKDFKKRALEINVAGEKGARPLFKS